MQSYNQVNLPLTWSTSTDTLSVVALLQQTVDTTDGELKTGFGRARLGLSRSAFADSSLARLGFSANFSRHCDVVGCGGGGVRLWWLWWWRWIEKQILCGAVFIPAQAINQQRRVDRVHDQTRPTSRVYITSYIYKTADGEVALPTFSPTTTTAPPFLPFSHTNHHQNPLFVVKWLPNPRLLPERHPLPPPPRLPPNPPLRARRLQRRPPKPQHLLTVRRRRERRSERKHTRPTSTKVCSLSDSVIFRLICIFNYSPQAGPP